MEKVLELEKKLSLYAKAHMAYYGELFTIKKSTYKKIIKRIAKGYYSDERRYYEKFIVCYFNLKDTDSLQEYAFAFQEYLSNICVWSIFKKNYQHSRINKGLQEYLEVKEELKRRGLRPVFQKKEIERNKYLTK